MPKKSESDKNLIAIKPKHSPEVLSSRIYSNYVEVSQSPYDFSLKFCDATPIYNMQEVQKNKGIHKIPIIAEIAIPSAMVKPLIDALQKQYDKYIEITGEANEKNQIKKNNMLEHLTAEEKEQFLNELLSLIMNYGISNSCESVKQCIESWEDIAEMNSIPGFKENAWKRFNYLKSVGKVY